MRYQIFIFISLLAMASFGQTASFTSSVSQGCSPLIVNFDASASSGTGTLNYFWDFGNGNTTSGTDKMLTSAIYTSSGNFTITLEVEDGNGSRSAAVTNTVHVLINPIANFSVDQPVNGCTPYDVSFTDLSLEGDATIVSWLWDFGDGNISTEQNPINIYTTTGDFDVTLVVEDANSCSGNFNQASFLSISDPFPLAIATVPSQSTIVSCKDEVSLVFDADHDNTQNGPYDYVWSFGDGDSSFVKSPVKDYDGFGNYTVRLEVTDQTDNCVVEVRERRFVQLQDVSPNFTVSDDIDCVPASIDFENTSRLIRSDQVVTWDFGDGTTVSGSAIDNVMQSPTHEYENIGSYSPRLIVNTNAGECIDTVNLATPITITDPPEVDFTSDITITCINPITIQFTSNAPTATSYRWDFGDGGTSTLENPTHEFSGFGNYSVSLAIEDAGGCVNDTLKTDLIQLQELIAEFTSDLEDNIVYPDEWDGRDDIVITGGCLPLDVVFEDLSISTSPIVSRDWDFGDGNSLGGNNAAPVNTYLSEGTFVSTLTITNTEGCTAGFTCDDCAIAGQQPNAALDITNYPVEMCCEVSNLFEHTTDPNTSDFFWYEVSTGQSQGYEITDPSADLNWLFEEQLEIPDAAGLVLDAKFYAYNNGCVDVFDLPAWGTVFQPYVVPNISIDQCVYSDSFLVDQIDFDSNIDFVEWNFAYDSQVSNEKYPKFEAPLNSGTYQLTVSAWDSTNKHTLVGGDSLCSCFTDQAYYFPGVDTVFDFNSDVQNGCIPLTVSFTGPTGFSAYEWDFGNGVTSTNQDAETLYDLDGNYDVRLIVFDAVGCADTLIKTGYISTIGPEVTMNSSVIYGCQPLDVIVKDITIPDAPITDRYWVVSTGDTITNTTTLNYTFSSALNLPVNQNDGFQLSLHLTDNNGCSNSDTIDVIVAKPRAEFEHVQIPECLEDLVQFQINVKEDTTGLTPLTFNWDLSTAISSEQNPTRNYEEGTYPIQVIFTDSLGCTDTSAVLDLVVDPIQPQAFFTADSTVGTCPPMLVTFEDTSVVGRSPIVAWEWTFGDGSDANIQYPQKIYIAQQGYDVQLKITDSLGCQDSLLIEDFINITGVLGQIRVSSDSACDSDEVIFVADSSNGTFFTWVFGDGTTAIGDSVAHTYTDVGIQIPTLLMEDVTQQCSFTIKDTVHVLPRPPIDLTDASKICEGETLTLSANSPGFDYLWSTGEITEEIQVAAEGMYKVVVTDPVFNCTSEDSVELGLTPQPDLIIGSDTCAEVDDVIQYEVQSDKIITTYEWVIESAVVDTDSVINVSVASVQQRVYVEITDEFNCSNNDSVDVKPNPEIDVTADSIICEGDSILISVNATGYTYDWSTGEVTESIHVKEAGTYNVVVTDPVLNCVSEDSVVLNLTPLPQLILGSDTCATIDQVIRYEVLSDKKIVNYEWSESGNVIGTDSIIDVTVTLVLQNVHVEIVDEFQCATTDSVAIKPNPVIELTPDSTICEGSNIVLSVNASGYTYEWSTSETSELITVSEPAVYSVIVKDDVLQCMSQGETNVALTSVPQIEMVDSVEACFNEELFINALVDKEVLNYSWQENGTVISDVNPMTYIVKAETRIVELVVEDVFHCFNTDSVAVSPIFPPSTEKNDFTACEGDTIVLNAEEIDANNLGSNYGWYRNDTLISEELEIVSTTTQQFELIFRNENCEIVIDVNTLVFEYPDRQGPYEPSYLCSEFGESVVLNPGSFDQYYWYDYEDSSSTLEVDVEGIFVVALGNEHFCFIDDSLEVIDVCPPEVFTGNTFSPNGDGLNDLYEVKGRNVASFEMKVFNRWGEVIFYSNKLSKSWDGTYNGKNMPEGMYPWLIEYRGIEPFYGALKQLEGKVMIVR